MMDIQEELKRKAQFKKIKDNQAKLDGCTKHRFPDFPEVLTLGTAFQCEHCKGVMQVIHAYSYAKGYEAHGGNPVDIIPVWNETFGKEQQEKSVVKGNHFDKRSSDN